MSMLDIGSLQECRCASWCITTNSCQLVEQPKTGMNAHMPAHECKTNKSSNTLTQHAVAVVASALFFSYLLLPLNTTTVQSCMLY